MDANRKVSAPPSKPLLIFDGDCHFCRFWVNRWRRTTGDKIDYLPSQSPSIRANYPEIPQEDFDRSVQYVEPDGTVYHGAEAVFRSLSVNPKKGWMLRWYYKVPGVRPVTEWWYRIVATNRSTFSALNRFFLEKKA